MIEYDYPELFEEHESVHFIIVNSGATVSSVSHDVPSISDNEFLITENEMKQEAFSLTESLCSLQNLKFGLGESSHVSFTVYNSSDIPNLKDEEITIYLYFNNDSDTLFEVGTYIIEEDKYSADRAFRDINAYDVLHYLWDYDITEWYNDYFSDGPKAIGLCRASLISWLAEQETDYTIQQVITLLVNDSYVIEKGIESDSITFGFFMQGILEVNGVFLHCNRQGKLAYIKVEWYDKDPVKVYDEESTFPPVKYEDYSTWGIGYVRVYDKNNKRLFKVGSSDKKYPSYYNIVDGFVFSNETKRTGWKSNTKTMLANMRENITHLNYKPCEFKAIGNLCYEVGDRINYTWVTYDENDQPVVNRFRTYILERTFTGIQGFKDTISAKGDKKQPKLVKTTNNWHPGDSSESGSGDGTGGVSLVDSEHDRLLIQKLRNVGIRMLNEPSNVTVVYNKQTATVDITWTDPDDISDYKPHPCEWIGTVVIRTEGETPIHRWDGERIVLSTTRDEYSETPFSDDTIQPNKKYYYAIMPYYIALDDADHPIRHYTWTKVVSVDTERILTAPTIYPIQDTQISGTTITVAYTIPTLEDGTYTVKKLVVKKGSIPLDKTDGDVIIDLTPDPTMLINGVDVSGLDENSTYYFVIFIEDEIGSSASSEPQDCVTDESIIPEEYRPYIAQINGNSGTGLDFFWADYDSVEYNGYVVGTPITNIRDMSYLVSYSAKANEEPNVVVTYFDSKLLMPYIKVTANITTDENNTYLSLNTKDKAADGLSYDYYHRYEFYYLKADANGIQLDSNSVFNEYSFWHYHIWCAPNNEDFSKRFSTLEACLKWLAANTRNINIFVDGEDWSTPA